MSRKYCTLEDVENYLLIDVATGFSSQINLWIQQMSKYVEEKTGRIFIADSSNSTRKFEIVKVDATEIGRFRETVKDIEIDECIEVVSLVVDDEEIDSDDYILYPANSTTKFRIKLTNDSGLSFSQDEQNIQVSAKWGSYVTTPLDIRFACTVLVAGIVNNAWTSEGELQSVSIGAYSLSYKDKQEIRDFEKIEEILKGYKKITI